MNDTTSDKLKALATRGTQAGGAWRQAPSRRDVDELPRAHVETIDVASSPAQVVESCRAQLGWSKAHMAGVLGVTADTYSRWCTGAFEPSLTAVRAALLLLVVKRACPGMLTGLLTVSEFNRKFEAIDGPPLRLGATVHLPPEVTPEVVRRLAVVVDGADEDDESSQ